MKKNYTLTITAANWEQGCTCGESIIETSKTTAPDWDMDGFAEWINDGKDMEDLQRIIDREDYADVQFTVTVTDENGNVTYDATMWESQAARIAMGV